MGSIVQWLSYNAYILDAGLAHGVYDQCKGPERDGLVAAQVDGVSLRIVQLRMHLVSKLVNIDRVVPDVDSLRVIDGNHDARFGNFLHCLGLRHVHLNAGLQDRRCNHENYQQHEHDVHKGNDVDL